MKRRSLDQLSKNGEHPAVRYYTHLKCLLELHQSIPDDTLPASPYAGVTEWGDVPEWTDVLTEACHAAETAATEAVEERVKIEEATGLPPDGSGLPNTTQITSYKVHDPHHTEESEEFTIPPEEFELGKTEPEQVEQLHVEQHLRAFATAVADAYGPERNHRVENVEAEFKRETDGGSGGAGGPPPAVSAAPAMQKNPPAATKSGYSPVQPYDPEATKRRSDVPDTTKRNIKPEQVDHEDAVDSIERMMDHLEDRS